jgi:hypothetical protein
MSTVTAVILSLGIIANAAANLSNTRWLARLSERVLDLEYPLQAKAKWDKS